MGGEDVGGGRLDARDRVLPGPLVAEAVDVGAPLSHAIIVSRELGIPCVISATGATRRIPNGARVRVDGSTGVVTVLDLP